MNTSYNLHITDEVTVHFEKILNEPNKMNDYKTIEAVKKTLSHFKAMKTEKYVTSRIESLENMLQMLSNEKWVLSASDKKYVLSALQYFTQEDDVIPDDIPVVGLLDDCIVIDIVADKVKSELKDFNEFIEASKIYARDDDYGVNDWIETKRKELYSRMRHRRTNRLRTRRTRGTSFSI